MSLRYKRLTNFCTLCSHLGHLYRECSVSKPLDKGAIPAEYGHWLRASSPVRSSVNRDRRRVADEGVAGTGKARSMGSGGHGGREGSILDDAVRGSRGLHSTDLERMGDGLIFNEAPHADGAHVKLMAAKSKVVHESITLAKMSSTTSIGADTSIQTNMDHARVSAFIGKPSSSLAMSISITQPVQRGEKLASRGWF
ncbi:hypothetical protein ACOSQ3_031881 [Xanthoceras sorbifolium]